MVHAFEAYNLWLIITLKITIEYCKYIDLSIISSIEFNSMIKQNKNENKLYYIGKHTKFN